MQSKVKTRIHFKIFLLTGLILSILGFVSFVGLMSAKEESSISANICYALFSIIRFPTHTLFWDTFQDSDLYAIGIFLNIVLYSFLAERLFYITRRLKNK
jgi:hypothetical protein